MNHPNLLSQLAPKVSATPPAGNYFLVRPIVGTDGSVAAEYVAVDDEVARLREIAAVTLPAVLADRDKFARLYDEARAVADQLQAALDREIALRGIDIPANPGGSE